MSQIELTLTAEHYGKIEKQYHRWWLDEDSDDERSFAETAIANPLTLTFELPSPWNYDISKAKKLGKVIILTTCYGIQEAEYDVSWIDIENHIWITNSEMELQDSEITAWMEIPALPEII